MTETFEIRNKYLRFNKVGNTHVTHDFDRRTLSSTVGFGCPGQLQNKSTRDEKISLSKVRMMQKFILHALLVLRPLVLRSHIHSQKRDARLLSPNMSRNHLRSLKATEIPLLSSQDC